MVGGRERVCVCVREKENNSERVVKTEGRILLAAGEEEYGGRK